MVSPKSKGWLLWDPVPEDIFPVLWTWLLGPHLVAHGPDSETLPERCRTGSSRSVWSTWWWEPQVCCCDAECVSVSSHFAVLQPTQQTHIALLDFTTTTTTAAAGYLLHVASEKIVGASPFLMRAKPSFHLHRVAVLIVLVIGQHCWSHLTKAKASSPNSSVWIQKVKFHIHQCCCCLAVINTKISNWKERVPSFQIQTADALQGDAGVTLFLQRRSFSLPLWLPLIFSELEWMKEKSADFLLFAVKFYHH